MQLIKKACSPLPVSPAQLMCTRLVHPLCGGKVELSKSGSCSWIVQVWSSWSGPMVCRCFYSRMVNVCSELHGGWEGPDVYQRGETSRTWLESEVQSVFEAFFMADAAVQPPSVPDVHTVPLELDASSSYSMFSLKRSTSGFPVVSVGSSTPLNPLFCTCTHRCSVLRSHHIR